MDALRRIENLGRKLKVAKGPQVRFVSETCACYLHASFVYAVLVYSLSHEQGQMDVNIPLLRELARATGYHDPGCVDMLLHGGPLLGELHCSGNGRPMSATIKGDVKALFENRKQRGHHPIIIMSCSSFLSSSKKYDAGDSNFDRKRLRRW